MSSFDVDSLISLVDEALADATPDFDDVDETVLKAGLADAAAKLDDGVDVVVVEVSDVSFEVVFVVDGVVVDGVVDSTCGLLLSFVVVLDSNKPSLQNSHNPCGFDFEQPFALGDSKQGKILHHLSLQLLHCILRVVSGIDVVR